MKTGGAVRDQDFIRLPWEYLQKSDGGVCYEGSGAEGRGGRGV